MNDFKKQYETKVEPELYIKMKQYIEQGIKETQSTIGLSEKIKRRNEIINLIEKAYEGKLRKEERQEFLSIDMAEIPNDTLKDIYELMVAKIRGEDISSKISAIIERTKEEKEVDAIPERVRREEERLGLSKKKGDDENAR